MPLLTTQSAKGLGFSRIMTPVNVASYDFIATQIAPSNGSNISFTGIPSTYKSLQVRGFIGSMRAGVSYDSLQYTLNNSGSGYYGGSMYGDSRPYTSNEKWSNATRQPTGEITGGSVVIYTGITIDIFDYADTAKSTTSRFFNGYDIRTGGNSSVNGVLNFGGGVWDSQALVSSIQFTSGTNSGFRENSRLSLYGIKG